jgi:hypothetical protein
MPQSSRYAEQDMRIALSVLTLLIASPALADTHYAMADLDALDKRASWDELINHAEDIPPSQRTDHWDQLVEHAGAGVLAGLDVDKVALSGLGTADGLTRRFPQLKKSKPFMQKRADIGLRAFARCFELVVEDSDKEACATRLVGFSDGDPDNLDLARRAADLVLKHQRAPAAAVPFYYRLMAKKAKAKECSEDAAKRAVVAALDLPKEDPRVAQAREIASQLCWDAMQNAVVDEILRETSKQQHHYFENTCGFLVEKKALGNLQTNRCKALSK